MRNKLTSNSLGVFFRRHPAILVQSSLRLLLSAFVIIAAGSVARAVSTAEYQESLKRAITALDTLKQLDEDESGEEFTSRVNETLAAVRTTLPETVSVDGGETFCSVDNSWLHEDLKKLESVDEDWYQALVHVIEKLKSIEERVAELQNPGPAGSSKASDKERLSQILQRPEYRTKSVSNSAFVRLLDRFLRWIARMFGRQMPSPSGTAATSVSTVLQIFVVALALAVLAYVARLLLPRLWRPSRKKRSAKAEARIVLGERLEPEQSAVDLLSEAETLARNGEVRAAIRKAYIALLVELGDRKLLSLAQHKTNRDYLRSVRSIPSLYPLMGRLTDSFERTWYGFAHANLDDWQNFREGYRTALQTKT